MGITILLAVLCAVLWGGPDWLLAQAARRIGAVALAFGATLVGTIAVAPAAVFVDLPEWSGLGVGIAIIAGVLSAGAYVLAYTAFRYGAVSIVAPIVSCEGAVAAAIALSTGEHVNGRVLALLVPAVVGVVLASMGAGGGRGGAATASVAALVWGGILVLSTVAADELGVYWGFLLIRVATLVAITVVAATTGVVGRWRADPWRVAIWGLADAGAYLLFVAAADRGPVAVASVVAAQFATVAVLVALVLGERPLRRQLGGVAIVIASVSAIAALG